MKHKISLGIAAIAAVFALVTNRHLEPTYVEVAWAVVVPPTMVAMAVVASVILHHSNFFGGEAFGHGFHHFHDGFGFHHFGGFHHFR
jgi:hypothetical protein